MQPSPAKPPLTAEVLPCSTSDVVFQRLDASADPVYTIAEGSTTMAAIKSASYHLATMKRPVAIPTETVYGLAADALDASAVQQIFSTKGRPADNPLIVHVSSRSMLRSLLPPSYTIPTTYERLITAFWPGPMTLLFPADPAKIPAIVTAGQPTVAIRMPSHPIARALIHYSQTPLAAPSANSSGRPSPTKAEHVWNDIGCNGKVGLILDGGPCEVGVESTVIDGITDPSGAVKVLRPGGVTPEQIEAILHVGLEPHLRPPVLVHRRDYEDKVLEQNPTTPGMKYLHYTPAVPVILALPATADSSITDDLSKALGGYSRLGALLTSESPLKRQLESMEGTNLEMYDLGPREQPSVVAQRLFDGLLTLEGRGVEVILVEGIQESDVGLAVMNRVRKAAKHICYVRLD